MSDSPSPPTIQSAATAADSLIARRGRTRSRSRTRPILTSEERELRSQIRNQARGEYPRRRKSCCERWFRWGSKKRNKKCKKKCKTRKRKRKSKTRKKKRKRKKRTRRK